MIDRTKAFVSALGLALALLLIAELSWAADPYPSRQIRWVVPWPAGGVADIQARIIADQLGKALGQQVMIDNRTGASGVLGADYVAKSKPDGYTLALFHASVVTTVTVVNPNVSYDPMRDFTPIANLVTNPLAVVVSAGSRWNSLEQLLDEAKAAPGKISCGIIGVGSHTHFNLELLKIGSGASINRVPFAGGTGPIITALLGGHIDCTSLVWPAVDGNVRAGKFRALGVTSRLKDFPQVPTFASKGYPQVNMEVFFAVYGPANLPQDVMAKLVPAFENVMKDPKNLDRLEKMGFSILYEGPGQLGDRVKHELDVVRDVARKAGIKQEQ